jgi:uncharacterized protein (TIGR02246 family)
MKKNHSLRLAALVVALFVFAIGCNTPADTKPTASVEATGQKPVMPDMAAIKAEIQTLENAWADADNARNANAIAAFYADDAISLSNNKPLIVGKAAIQKDIEASLAKKAKGSTVTYDIMDVFGSENTATEVGKTTVKDSTGKVTYTGKYMAIWEKRDGKYVCIRDMSNDDVKEK